VKAGLTRLTDLLKKIYYTIAQITFVTVKYITNFHKKWIGLYFGRLFSRTHTVTLAEKALGGLFC
jgi:hypothetical protein